MSGVETHKATTTIKVAEINITREEFFERIKQSLQKSGWLASMKEDEADKFVKQDVDELLKIANHFDVGSVVEKRGNKFRQREKMSKKTDDVFYCLDCDKKIKKGGEAIQVRTGYISEGSFDAEEDVAYYHVVCFNQLTGRNFPPAKLGKNLEKIEGLK